jgi:hypothetical protein
VSSVNVGDKVKGHVVSAVVLESLGDHDRAAARCQSSTIGEFERLTDQNHRYQC